MMMMTMGNGDGVQKVGGDGGYRAGGNLDHNDFDDYIKRAMVMVIVIKMVANESIGDLDEYEI